MGVPVICNGGIGDTDRIMKESRAGFLCESLDENSYENAVEQIPILMSKNRDDIRREAIRHFSLEYGISQYLNLYQSMELTRDDRTHSVE